MLNISQRILATIVQDLPTKQFFNGLSGCPLDHPNTLESVCQELFFQTRRDESSLYWQATQIPFKTPSMRPDVPQRIHSHSPTLSSSPTPISHQ